MSYKISKNCMGCGRCLNACPAGAIKAGDVYTIDAGECMGCAACVPFCPIGAIEEN